MNTQQYIDKARSVHGDLYSYDKCVYAGSLNKVIITCKTHGDWLVNASSHINKKSGCPACAKEKSQAAQTMTKDKFIERAITKHGDKYDYSKVDYKHSKQNVTILCRIHGPFEQTVNTHLKGSGCKNCTKKGNPSKGGSKKKLTTAEFISRAKEVHGDRYKYDKVKYEGAHTKITIICDRHGDFEITPHSHRGGSGCLSCGIASAALKRKFSCEEFVRQVIEVHGDKYDYAEVKYKNIDTPVQIICRKHGVFEQPPYDHIRGRGCPDCGKTRPYTTESYISKCRSVHKDKYTYEKTTYVSAHKKVVITCPLHGAWETEACSHINGNGCPRCWRCATSSKMQVQWLEWQAVKLGLAIEHCDNVGEHRISNSRYYADGYDPVSNTIWEFNGSYFHGCPLTYKADDINEMTKKRFGELYEQTLKKRNHILSEGYKLVEIWEIDWLANLQKVKVIQRAFRSLKLRRT